MAWFCLVIAGLLEVVWASALDRAHQPLWLAVTVVGLGASVGLLAVATRAIPLGLAYAAWVGIGVVGTAAVSVLLKGERIAPAQLAFLAVIAVGIAGMKITAQPAPEGAAAVAER